ncbi:hypothetical protein MANES_08G156100v8 [Manihot esculenta]|uniref:Uncharacterized protein n=1 Tax=Manihot esculenta TaxID=3983 RepID=A0A2C9VIN0_MANES|nr:hypothetical protein MANES_08G156100v8 [Manihot esculenta]
MGNRGPSPVVPSLMVGILGLIVFGPMLMEYVVPLFEAGEDEGASFSFIMVLPLLLLVILHLISTLCPRLGMCCSTRQRSSSYGHDSEGYGLGTLLLLVLFFVLYSIWSSNDT